MLLEKISGLPGFHEAAGELLKHLYPEGRRMLALAAEESWGQRDSLQEAEWKAKNLPAGPLPARERGTTA